jgi:BirA family biotin operon repressor/biotin-[acetyl-CoA-carboxylase] ligase
VTQSLREYSNVPIKLKWPNDILVAYEKMGGILVEIDGALEGPLNVVVGLGLNVSLAPEKLESHDWSCTDLARHMKTKPSRNQVALRMIQAVLCACDEFETSGFAPFKQSWMDLHAYADKIIEVMTQERKYVGIARGIDDSGAMLVEVDGTIQAVSSGDVSIRLRT